MKICLICSPGGHLIESLKLLDAFKLNEIFLITYNENFDCSTSLDIKRIYLIKNLLVGRVGYPDIIKYIYLILSMILLTIRECWILLNENPDVIVSTGSEIAIPAFYIAKLLRKKTVFIESLTRINKLSGTGRIVYPITDIFFVQWEDLANKYKKSIYKGNILRSIKRCSNKNKGNYIFVTVGTASFKRLVATMDNISKHINEKILIQLGRTDYKPKTVNYFKFTKNLEEFTKLNKNAKLIISHAGVGNIINALENDKPLIIMPRKKEYNEHIDDHQFEMAKALEGFPSINIAYTEDDILRILEKIDLNEKNDKNSNSCDNVGSDILNYLKETLKTWSSEKSGN